MSLLCTTFREWGSHVCTWKITFCTLQIWLLIFNSDKICFLNPFFVTFSILLISASNMFETRIHQLNENVDSTSGFEMFSSLWNEFKVTFLIYLGWIVNYAILVYLKFNIFQNCTTHLYERFHFRPNFATYKCTSMLPLHLNYNQTINEKCSSLQ